MVNNVRIYSIKVFFAMRRVLASEVDICVERLTNLYPELVRFSFDIDIMGRSAQHLIYL